jgi:hypothetical protein
MSEHLVDFARDGEKTLAVSRGNEMRDVTPPTFLVLNGIIWHRLGKCVYV